MTLTKTPICDFGKKADHFELKFIEDKILLSVDLSLKLGAFLPKSHIGVSIAIMYYYINYVLRFKR